MPISASGESAKWLANVDQIESAELNDWGVQPDAIEGASHSSGVLLYKGPDNKPESGFWQVTPGTWRLSIPRDEFCHFVAGEATYTEDDGSVIEVRANTCVHFKAGWSGVCTVHSTLRNLYMLTA